MGPVDPGDLATRETWGSGGVATLGAFWCDYTGGRAAPLERPCFSSGRAGQTMDVTQPRINTATTTPHRARAYRAQTYAHLALRAGAGLVSQRGPLVSRGALRTGTGLVAWRTHVHGAHDQQSITPRNSGAARAQTIDATQQRINTATTTAHRARKPVRISRFALGLA